MQTKQETDSEPNLTSSPKEYDTSTAVVSEEDAKIALKLKIRGKVVEAVSKLNESRQVLEEVLVLLGVEKSAFKTAKGSCVKQGFRWMVKQARKLVS